MKVNKLKDKVAIVTGAAGGIGSEIASLFDKDGALLVLADINSDGLARLASKLSRKPLLVQCDITDKERVKNLMESAVTKFGRVDILVNNAGIITPGLFEDSRYEDIERQVDINLMGAIYCTREVIPLMKTSGGGNIVTISSLAGIAPETYSAIYTATKYALRGFGLTLRVELKKHNIYVSTIFPDSVDTPMLKYEASHGGSPLTFLNPPVSPAVVAKAVRRAVVKRKIELYVPYSQGLASKIIICLPWIIPFLWPILEKKGAKKKETF